MQAMRPGPVSCAARVHARADPENRRPSTRRPFGVTGRVVPAAARDGGTLTPVPSGAVAGASPTSGRPLPTCAAVEIACPVRDGRTTAPSRSPARTWPASPTGTRSSAPSRPHDAAAGAGRGRPGSTPAPTGSRCRWPACRWRSRTTSTSPATRPGTARRPPRPTPARRDDELVKRLRAAGAVVVGKTRMPELAALGLHPLRRWAPPATRWTATLDPGGASGGGAAAVAAGMAALALGTDGGGSMRIPAAYCGLVGLKPGSRACCRCPAARTEHWFGLLAAGPLARTASDAALLLGVLAGAAGRPRRAAGAGAGRAVAAPPVPVRRGCTPRTGRPRSVRRARLRAGPGGAAVTAGRPALPARTDPALVAPLAGRRRARTADLGARRTRWSRAPAPRSARAGGCCG